MREELDGLNFAIEKSMRYHQRRRAHYERLHRLVMLLIIISGSAAFARYQPEFAGLGATVLGALDLVFGLGTKARDHHVLYRQFSDLARRARKIEGPAPAELEELRNERLAIEVDEPPIFWALETDCYDEVCRAWGRQPSQQHELRWYHRLLMHWLRFEQASFTLREVKAAA